MRHVIHRLHRVGSYFRFLSPRFVLLLCVVMAGCGRKDSAEKESITRPLNAAVKTGPAFPFPKPESRGFATSDSCLKCHPDQHASWHASYHRTMTQPAGEESVLAPFDGRELSVAGTRSQVRQKDGEYFVSMPHPRQEHLRSRNPDAPTAEIPQIDAKIVMTTGSHFMQTYWVEGELGRELWQFPWQYDIQRQRWVHRKDVFLWRQDGWRPGMMFTRWNQVCILCHSTGGVPGWNPASDVLESTQVAELGIACESCHGPGRDHVIAMESQALRGLKREASSAENLQIVNPARLDKRASSDVCGRCHSHSSSLPEVQRYGHTFRPGDRLTDHVRLLRNVLDDNGGRCFWEDGTACSGGREYSGMVASKCFTADEMTCLSCHSMHESNPNKQIAAGMNSNQACTQCHETYGDNLEAHTHHPADSAGSLCYNCHMPRTSFALIRAGRSHRVQSPSVSSIGFNTRPNACNLCHLDKTLKWTAETLTEWYDQAPVELAEDEQTIAASLLWMLRGDALQRSVTAWHAGWKPAQEASETRWIAPFLAEMLHDDYPVVRQVAHSAFLKFPGYEDLQYDFDASPDELERATRRVQETWSGVASTAVAGADVATDDESTKANTGQKRAGGDLSGIPPGIASLLSDPVTVNRDAIRKLMERRDRRPMRLME